MQTTKTQQFVNKFWDTSILPALSEYIRIPCVSPSLDVGWEKKGHIMRAAKFLEQWAKAQKIPGLKSKILKLPGKSPVLYIEIPGSGKNTVVFYGHLDKMPESGKWAEGLSAWKPVIKNNWLYGRGAVDDGYAFFSYIAAIKNLEAQKIPYNRCVLIIEACEESSSYDFPFYLKKLRSLIGKTELMICLDVAAGDYKKLWLTSALRGIVKATLTVKVLNEPVHSGTASGMIPSSFRVMRQLLSRLEDPITGKILLKSCHTKIPTEQKRAIKDLVKVAGKTIYTSFPMVKGLRPVSQNLSELLLNRCWRPALSITGAGGLPSLQEAGNVVRPETTLFLSLRIPPFCKPAKILHDLEKLFTHNPPYGATVIFKPIAASAGWANKKIATWLHHELHKVSKTYFGANMLQIGEGGSIGVIPMLNEAFPKAQVILTGVMGQETNEHAPNEKLPLAEAKKMICCISDILAKQYQNTQ